MIQYRFHKDNGTIQNVHVEGHALFGAHGTDIVCSAVSTALIMTANAIEILGFKKQFKVKIESGFFELNVIKSNDTIEGLLKNLEYTMNELETQYKTYIKNQKEG
ncbi:Predicted ribosomal protein [Acholeplasma oculi]|uniref:Ribosomal processing cysteine protease Prp n=1 Tax=Acholeplasma oculi TaxID=35623 RepID=A0A061AB77_9MOLU|nr:ribosomal-processing cysteine protease Prp [Acholeplasma oculi]CDR31145.1 hypothetical protein, DUF464 [Acholeplasma oculi]SKC37464.1 hypothetical protein SAMN02745122_0502 [Acholeplasma oculi]SUT90941.1 Predicted ribosomal protein [Acholeplasma oculi]